MEFIIILKLPIRYKYYHNWTKKEGAIIEGSKDFSKAFMKRHRIPTAKSKSFNKNQLTEALEYLDQKEPPYVLKADGLAAGKGVIIENNLKKRKLPLRNYLMENSENQVKQLL